MKSALLGKARTPAEVPRWFPSTKTCPDCGHIQDVALDEAAVACQRCGAAYHRDLRGALNTLKEGCRTVGVPAVRRESTPADTGASASQMLEYFKTIPWLDASPVAEAGSLTASA